MKNLIRNSMIVVLVLTLSLVSVVGVFAQSVEVIPPESEPDYSKLYGEIYDNLINMSDDESATVFLYLTCDKGYTYEVSEDEVNALYNEREADNKAFLQRYTSISDEDILFVSKYARRVAVNANKEELESFLCDPEVKTITDFKQSLCLSNGMTGAELSYSLEEYIVREGSIDDIGFYLNNVGESNGYTIVSYSMLPIADEVFTVRIGNYIFLATWNSLYYLGLYAIVDGEFVTIEDAWQQGYISLDDAAQVYGGAKNIENLGDFDKNGEVNVKDSTLLQKALAGLEEMPKLTIDFQDFEEIDVTDFNGDGKLNIRDATAIQKHIAGIAY